MSKRFTDTEKWNDKWFRSLNPYEKLLWNYLCDNCNLAGFYEIDEVQICFDSGLSKEQVSGAWQGLGRGIEGANGWVWVKNFLKHQKNLPLNPLNNAHKHIIGKFHEQKDRFNLEKIEKYLGATEGLLSPIGKGIGKGNVIVHVNSSGNGEEKGGAGEKEDLQKLEAFKTEYLSRQILSEKFCYLTKVDPADLPKLLDDFNAHVFSMGKKPQSFNEYQDYLTKWKLNKNSIVGDKQDLKPGDKGYVLPEYKPR